MVNLENLESCLNYQCDLMHPLSKAFQIFDFPLIYSEKIKNRVLKHIQRLVEYEN
jgi:hypothetical protein